MIRNLHFKRRWVPRRGSLFACALAGATVFAQTTAATKADPQKAQLAYVAGAKALDRRDLAAAQAEFARAAQLDPRRADYAMAMTLTREHRVSEMVQRAALLRMTNQPQQADKLLAEARTIDPNNELVLEHTQAAAQGAPQHTVVTPKFAYLPPVEVQPTPGRQDLQLRGDTRQVVTRAAQAFGLKVVYDDSVTSSGPALRFDLQQTTYGQAMPILLRMAHLFAVPLDQKTLMVVKDSEENRTKFERLVEETIYIPGSTTEQMNELSNIVKNVFDVKQLVVSPGSGTIAVRAPAATVKAVNYTLADMIDGGAEVVMELKLITVDKMVTRNVGISPLTSASAFSAAAEVQSFVSANQSLLATAISSGAFVPSGSAAQQLIESAAFLLFSGLATDAKLTNVIRFFGNGLTLFGASIGGGATLNAALNSSDSRALDDITIRAGNGQEATLRVGEKYPVTTATYSSGISSSTASALAGVSVNGVSASSLVNQYLGSASTATIPQVQYEDLGITLKTTPRVLRSGLVSLHIDLKIEALTGASLDNIPVLTSSNFVSDITVEDGSSAIMLSDMTKSQSASVSGFPGLGELPGFQETLSNTTKTTDDSELVLLITPHVVRRRNNSTASRVYPFSTSAPAEN
jgi:type II secretory pathway component GspD/PulD (secretin)